MNAMVKNIVASLIASAIVGQTIILWQFNSRLTVIETKLSIQTQNIAQK